jgi:hypothetical protein
MPRPVANVEAAYRTMQMGVPEVRGCGVAWPSHALEILNTCLEIGEAKKRRATRKQLEPMYWRLAKALERWRVAHESASDFE